MNACSTFHSSLGPSIAAYLQLKQALGREYRNETVVLADLDRFLVAKREPTLTAPSFAAWTLTLTHLTPTVRRSARVSGTERAAPAIHLLQRADHYLTARRQLPLAVDGPLLVNSLGQQQAYTGAGLAQGLRRLFRAAEVRTAAGELPRVHDLRHTHAVHVLLRWYHAGIDVQSQLPTLATAMGHVSVVSTAYYLSWLEPVAEAANERFLRHVQSIFGPTGGADHE